MSDTYTAIRAAKEVQADVLAPELYRQANEWFYRARKEYKLKNFELAENFARKARHFAEQAEFEVIRNGGSRGDSVPDADATANAGGPSSGDSSGAAPSTPSDIPTSHPTPIEEVPAASAAAAKASQTSNSSGSTPPAPSTSPSYR